MAGKQTPGKSKAQIVREYITAHSRASNKAVAAALKEQETQVTPGYVASIRRAAKKKGRKRSPGTKREKRTTASPSRAKFPRHPLEKVLRIPRAILEQNAGKPCTDRKSAEYVGVGYGGPYRVEISSAIKYGLLSRPRSGELAITALGKSILRPQEPGEELKGLRQAVVNAPEISEVYNHYRGENLPDTQFLDNALVDKFSIPQEKVPEFKSILFETLKKARLLEEHAGKHRVVDFTSEPKAPAETSERIKKLGKAVSVDANDTCFVVMPFASPHGEYYSQIYDPAIRKAGLRPVRADDEIFGSGKIMNQIWSGINTAKVLVAELTTKNPNVFYELGLAHARKKPVVLVSANEEDVPFDLHHIRVIYYDVNDPFWGQKLLEKVAENILSALRNPQEAIFEGEAKVSSQ